MTPRVPAVVHFGNVAQGGGGIASVIRSHLARGSTGVRLDHVPTYDQDATSPVGRWKPIVGALVATWRLAPGDVAHVHLSQGGSLLREGSIVLLARLRRRRVLITLHGSSLAAAVGPKRRAVQLICSLADAVHGFDTQYRDRFRVPASRWLTIPNDVRVPPRHLTDKEPVVLFAGELGLRKGTDVLLHAWESLPSLPWTLVLAGAVARDFALPPLPANARHTGPLSHDRLLEQMERAAIVVQPSRAEAFPMAVCEGLANGCAVVGSAVGAMGTLLSAAGQTVVEDGTDARSLAAALAGLMTDDDARRQQATRGYAYAWANLSSSEVSARWAEAYERLGDPGFMSGLGEVLAADLMALGLPPRWRWRYVATRRIAYFTAVLRLVEHLSRDRRPWRRPAYYLVRWRFELLAERMGLDIPPGVFGPGLSVAHRGCIVVNGDSVVGRNCRIHQGVTLGAINGQAPTLGDDVFIGPGAGIYGPVRIGNGATIGPHALVIEDVPDGGTVVGAKAALRPTSATASPTPGATTS